MLNKQEVLNKFFFISKSLKRDKDDQCLRLSKQEVDIILEGLLLLKDVSKEEAENKYKKYEQELEKDINDLEK